MYIGDIDVPLFHILTWYYHGIAMEVLILPNSLVKRAYQGLLNHSKNPVSLKMISGKSS
ncbi:hypothetical protein C1646_771121 [Rhizophagus diaphanus]|nr:hypothetical protein C1646_771121 [Rhizophagus diaphanus] [Rhizophagus sp. MUCL 43196]